LITRTNVSDKVSEWLIQAMDSGRFPPGERLPSVEQLADDLQVGRSSVREALRQLQALGRVSLRHGVGTFVSMPVLQLGSEINSFSEAIRQRGMIPGSVILERAVVQPDAPVAERLQLEPGESANLLKRLRLANGEPLAIEVSYSPCRLFPDLLDGPWHLDTSLYALMEQKYKLVPQYAEQTIWATLITREQCQLLQTKEGSPGIGIRTLAYSPEGIPMECSQDIYRGDRYQYTVTLLHRR
jgi:GntR family transcriptional regulator